ncbi:hypothetical protein ABH930_003084 [Kitasatospora sp. GAS204A]|uniref:DUF2510 domain-containing protein n=1 Tax=unclassified Kitasatospora TaxID=2633591 RepID=UPI0024769A8D|nr:DUF2510 domain-containing protein [Kitasatospora sp. GAS204B]MDH6117555.1 hypothetical protein [Kitasatospora sp. GAS204B]
MSEAKIPAGWYPDPQDTTSDPRPERWWDGMGWTATTRPGDPGSSHATGSGDTVGSGESGSGVSDVEETAVLEGTQVIEGEVLENGAVRYPVPPDGPGPSFGPYGEPLPPQRPSVLRRISRPVLITAAVAALLGAAVGSGITYLATDHHGSRETAQAVPQQPNNPQNGGGRLPGQRGGGSGGSGGSTGGNGFPGIPGFPGGGNSGGNSGGSGSGGTGGGSGQPGVAADMNSGIQLPVPTGWQGGTAGDGTAFLAIGPYQCPGAGSGSGGSGSGGGTGGSGNSQQCTLGGVNTGQIQGTDPQAAAKQDIVDAANASYPGNTGHKELESQSVTVDGRAGYLVRWQVNAAQGNNGTVESVVFPSADGKSLISVRLGFDIAAKAPAVSQMDTIVSGITNYSGSGAAGGNASGGTTT